MIHRRLFLGGMLAGAVAPAIVRAESLMRVVPVSTLNDAAWNWLQTYAGMPYESSVYYRSVSAVALLKDAGMELGVELKRWEFVEGQPINPASAFIGEFEIMTPRLLRGPL